MLFRTKFHCALAAALFAPALADDAPFLTSDPTSVPEPGSRDLLQWFSWGTGNTGQSHNGFQSVTEFDYTVTDRLQVALMLVYDWSRTKPPGLPAETESLPGIAAEALYVAMPNEGNPFGLAFAVDPTFNARTRGVDFRILLQKDFLGLENVLNINFQNAWEKDVTGHWQGASGLSFNYGLGYAIDENWTVAFEFGNDRGFDGLLTAAHFRTETNTYFAGPSIQYDCELVVVSLGAQAQLPWAGGSTAVNGYTPDAERLRVALRFAKAI